MRGFTLRAVPVCLAVFACGCFLTGGTRTPNGDAAKTGATPTHAYWQRVGAILAQRPTGPDLPAMVSLVRTQTDALRELPTDGVDPDLVAAVESVIKCEAEVLRRADMVDSDPARLKASKELSQVFADANRAAAEAKKRLRAMQPALNTRHGGGFAPLAG